MQKQYDTIVYIGRFQPVHNAHVETIRRAKSLADNVIVIIGSAYQPRTYKNPFTTEERIAMVRKATSQVGDPKCSLSIDVVRDNAYNNTAWALRIQEIVSAKTKAGDRVGIIGHEKDASSFYFKLFPQWEHINVELLEPLHATDIRDLYFRKDAHEGFIRHVVPDTVFRFMTEFMNTEDYKQVIREREFIDQYRRQYASFPYPPVFVTVDAAVICSGHVLMIRRRAEPGRGLLALPGGFLDANSDTSVQDAMVRELREETKIKVPAPVIVGSISGSRVFDAIGRSARGRTITHCFKVVLPDGELPKVKGSDDAERAQWIPLSEVASEECFEDHYDLVQWAIGEA